MAADPVKVDSAVFGALEARALGPAVTGGRIAAIDGVGSNPNILYVGSAGGGVWKTINGGTTFKPIFDKYTQSIGAITVDQSKPDTVWVGTGEPWVRNSTSYGNGVYKSTDGGDNWQYMGLPDSERIGKIVVDPKDSNTVYVAVLGHLWNGNENRGLYQTTDGGKTWNKILYVDADTGCTDVVLDPQEPNVVYASTWTFRRWAWKFNSGGTGSGIHRSLDGGKTWERMKNGLPEGNLGRIALAIPPARPSTIYAVVEAKKTGFYVSNDMGQTWTLASTAGSLGIRPFYFSLLVADPKDYKKVYKPGMFLSVSKDGGKTWQDAAQSVHSDFHALWIDPQRATSMYLGTDGGVWHTNDAGASWSLLRNLPVPQFYHVTYDMALPYNVYGGLQDNGSWAGPSQGHGGSVENKDWLPVGFGDGFNVFADPADKNIIYSEWQGGKLQRYTRDTGELKSISPRPKAGEPKYRFNWNAPAVLSPNDPKTIYLGGQFLFRSRDRGESWERISTDLTTNDPAKLKQEESGGLSIDNSGAENHCTIYTIAESPKNPSVIWAGTDDGNLQITQDGGKTWANVVASVQGLPKNPVVTGVEPSHYAAGTAYVTFDNHQAGDMKPYVYKTTDFGKTWTAISTDAIKGYAHVVREDLVKQDLLFVGTELGLFLSIDGGQQWAQFTGNLPNVAVRDLAIHPRESDLIVATHGRGIYIVDDISPLRQLTPQIMDSKLTVLDTKPAPIRFSGFDWPFNGGDEFVAQNPREAAFITYYMKERHTFGDFNIEIRDSEGKLVTKLPAGRRRGINRVAWPMRLKAPRVPTGAGVEGGSVSGPMAPEGAYTAKLVKGEETYTAALQLVGDPMLPHAAEDRKLQQVTVMKLYRALEQLAFIDGAITDARDQARDRSRKLKDAETKPFTAFADKLEALHGTLTATKEGGMLTGEERLREMLGELYGEVSRYGGRPTQSQVDRTAVLDQEVVKAGQDFDGAVAANLDSLNTKLKAKGLEPMRRMTKEEFDKKQGGNASGAAAEQMVDMLFR